MSKSMIGYTDRKAPVKGAKVITVREVIDRTYKESDPEGSFKAMTDQRRGGFENEVFTEAVDLLDPADAAYIESQIRRADPDLKNKRCISMKNFGRLAMTELLAKTGIFLAANGIQH